MSTQRVLFGGVFAACAGLMAFAFFLEYVKGLQPCPLCLFQRLFFITIGAVALLAVVHDPGRAGRRVYATLMGLLALGGAAVAARHIWLQHLPADQVPECGPGLRYMIAHFPLMDAISRTLGGSGECATVNWRFLGMSIPEWSILAFALLFVFSVWMFRRRGPAAA